MKMGNKNLLIILFLVIGQVYNSSAMQERHSIEALLAEEVIIAGDYTLVGIYAGKDNNPSDVKVAYLELFNEAGEAVVQEMGYLEKGVGNIPLHIPENLPSGYYLFRTYTSDSDWDNKSSHFNSWIAVINPDDPPIISNDEPKKIISPSSQGGLKSDKDVYAKKEQVQIKISPNGQRGISYLSVKQLLPGIDMPNRVSLIDQPVDNPKFREHREIHGHVVKISNLLPGEQVFLSSMGRYKEMYFAEPGEDGIAYIFMDSKRSFDDLILQSTLQSESAGMEVSSPFWEVKPKVKEWPRLEIAAGLEETLKLKALGREIKKHFYLPDTALLAKPAPLIDAYHVYNLDDFTRFETLGETFKEYIPQVVLRNRRGKTEFRLRNVGGITKENPLVLLDGVPIFDIDGLSKWPPTDIKRIEINNRYLKLGSKEVQGIINIESFKGDLAMFPLGEHALVLDYPKPQPQLEFNFPEHSKANRKPDFRSLLYWKIIDGNSLQSVDHISFYTAESPGTYIAKMKYLTEEGIWREDATLFSVSE